MTQLAIDLHQIYKNKEDEIEFKSSKEKIEMLLLEMRLKKFEAKGLMKLTTKEKVKLEIPPKLPGRPWSMILKEIRE